MPIPGQDRLAVEPQDPGEQIAVAEVLIGPFNSRDYDRIEAESRLWTGCEACSAEPSAPGKMHTIVGSSVATTPKLRRSAASPVLTDAA